jgi:hypothetical protein
VSSAHKIQAEVQKTVLGLLYIGTLQLHLLSFGLHASSAGRPEARQVSGVVQLGHKMYSIGEFVCFDFWFVSISSQRSGTT